MSSTPSFDLVIRIALLRAHDDPNELVPNIWRRFRCSSEINLDAFQDKIVQPLMGWTRNYHTYYFQKSSTFYIQNKSAAVDAFGMHDSNVAQGKRLNPENFTLGDLLSNPNDSCFYAYDLGDHWYHKLTLEKAIRKSDIDESDQEEMALFGKCAVLDGAMRCPAEDGEGGSTYQENILDAHPMLHTFANMRMLVLKSETLQMYEDCSMRKSLVSPRLNKLFTMPCDRANRIVWGINHPT